MIHWFGAKTTAKQWALRMVQSDLSIVTGYFPERWEKEWDAMTQKERDEISRQVEKLEDRFKKIISRGLK
jgi:hypothetical protein